MSDLIERLNDAWRKLYGDGDEHAVCDTIAEAAELARMVEGAAVVEMPSRPGPALQGASLVIGAAAAERMGLAGQRVRIVPEDGLGGGE